MLIQKNKIFLIQNIIFSIAKAVVLKNKYFVLISYQSKYLNKYKGKKEILRAAKAVKSRAAKFILNIP